MPPSAPDPAPTVGPLEPADAEAVARLLDALGYPGDPAAVATRLARLANYDGAVAFGAARDGGLVGLATAHAFPVLHAEALAAQLTALVVADEARGRGVGRALVRAAEAWAAGRGAARLTLGSGAHRAGAHRFYEALGYADAGRRFARALRDG